MTTISIFTASPIAAAGLGAVIATMEGVELAGSWSCLADVASMTKAGQPDILLLEMMPSLSLQILRDIAAASPGTAMVLWIENAPAEFISQAVTLGVRGVLRRTSSVELLEECLNEVAANGLWLDQELSRRMLMTDRIALSRRERQLMGLVAQGLRNKEMAWSLGITEGTVKVYLSRLFSKLGVGDRLELALLALKNIAMGASGMPPRMPLAADERPVPLQIPQFLNRERTELSRGNGFPEADQTLWA